MVRGEPSGKLRVVALRRASQVFLLLLFLFLLLRTEFRGTVGAGGDVRMHWPCGCSSRLIRWRRSAMRWRPMRSIAGCCGALIILLPVMFLGRFFCGWICPMGTIHHFFGNLRSEKKRGKQGIEATIQALAEDEVRHFDLRCWWRRCAGRGWWGGSTRSACWCGRWDCRFCPARTTRRMRG